MIRVLQAYLETIKLLVRLTRPGYGEDMVIADINGIRVLLGREPLTRTDGRQHG